MTILAVSTSLATAQQAKKPAVIKLGMITKFPAVGFYFTLKHFSADSILLVGYDAQPEEVAAIKAGDEDASVAQFPSRIGSLGIATTWKVVTKQKVAKNVDTGTALVTKANAGQFG
jgi:ABC-type sugar transport system substrate-binding protein